MVKFNPITTVHHYDKTRGTLMKCLDASKGLEGAAEHNGRICRKNGRRVHDVVHAFLRGCRVNGKRIKTLKKLRKSLANKKVVCHKIEMKTSDDLENHMKRFLASLHVLPRSRKELMNTPVFCKGADDLRLWVEEGLEIFRKPRKLKMCHKHARLCVSDVRFTETHVMWREQMGDKMVPKQSELDNIAHCRFLVHV